MKPLFEAPKRFTTIDKASTILVYDALNLFFSVTLSKFLGVLATADGRPSSQVYGTFTRIRSHITKFTKSGQRVALVFAWDNEPEGKRMLFPGYKMNRDAGQVLEEEEHRTRMESFVEMLMQLPCTFVEAEGEEADDVIAALAFGQRKPTCVMSSDKDLWQLLTNPRVKIVSLRKSEVVTEADLMAKYALNTRRNAYKIALYKAVMGDASDNIPKVPRIPSKAFHEALNGISYDPEDDCVGLLLEAASALEKPRAYNLLVEHETMIRRNLEIVTLKKNLEYRATYYEGNQEALEGIFQDFECYSLLDGGKHEFLYR
jgi:DNA polymerase-1